MNKEQLKIIEAYCNATTQGQWELEDNGFIYTRGSEHGTAWDLFEAIGSADENQPNGKFVIFAHEDMPKLVAEIRHLNNVNTKRIAEYRALEQDNARLKAALAVIAMRNIDGVYSAEVTADIARNALKGGSQ